jgi:hypothetical protein
MSLAFSSNFDIATAPILSNTGNEFHQFALPFGSGLAKQIVQMGFHRCLRGSIAAS